MHTDLIHWYASLPHYARHLSPIWQALPPDARGHSWAAKASSEWGSPLPRHPDPGPCLVASLSDARKMRGRPLVYVEHGAGQQYRGDPRSERNGSYAGGDGLDDVQLFLCPSERVSQLWQERYPDARTAVVGCPALDEWHRKPKRQLKGEVVAVAWHVDWPNWVPETRSAWPHYRRAMPGIVERLRANGLEVIGHGHPRVERQFRREYERLGIPWASLDELLGRADVLCVDNSSIGPEAASLGIPLVWLNAPWYRRDVDHGGRWWDWPRGQVQVDDPASLVAAVLGALDDPPMIREAREGMVREVYAYTDGGASDRAVAAITASGVLSG